MDVEAQVISLVGEMESEARVRVVAYLHARYQEQERPHPTFKVARKASAARVGRVVAKDAEPVTVAVAAKAAHVQKATIYTWIKRGKLKTTPGGLYRGGHAQLVSVADIRAIQEQ